MVLMTLMTVLLLLAPAEALLAPAEAGPSSLPRGVVDVTACGAEGDGKTDDTKALQAAVDAAFASHSVLYFPAGNYLISGSLNAFQDVPGSDLSGVNIVPARFHAHVLLGAAGHPRRPRLVLAAASPGFQNPSAPKHMLWFHKPNCYMENDNMNQILRGIDFEIGPGNPGAVAVHFHGAQGGTIQDVNVDAGDGLAGFFGAVGAGGSFVNVEVRGGRYGLLVLDGDSESSSAVAGSTFLNQRASAVHWLGQQSLVLVGTRIVQPAGGAQGAPVMTVPLDLRKQGSSPILLIDCVVECAAATAAVDAGSSVFMHNVFLRGCSALVQQMDPALPVKAKRWSLAVDVSFALDAGDNIMRVAYVDGKRHVHWSVGHVTKSSAGPPADLQSQHSWDNSTFPSFEQAGAVDATKECGAVGNGMTDDTNALQHCLDTHDVVVLPLGRYRVSRTLVMRDGRSLVGLSPTHSQIVASDDSSLPGSFGSRIDSDSPSPLLRTSTGRNTLAFVGLTTFWHIANVTTLDWRATDARSIWRSNYETRVGECAWWDNYGRGAAIGYGPPPACKPPVLLNVPKTTVRGGGKFFNFVNDVDVCMTGPGYRHLLITNPAAAGRGAGQRSRRRTRASVKLRGSQKTPPGSGRRRGAPHRRVATARRYSTARARFYGMNLEHAMGAANAEVARSRQGVDVFGVKIEGSNPIFWIRDSDDVNIWGVGGGADAFPTENGTSYYPAGFERYPPSLFRVERTPRYRMVCTLNMGRAGANSHPAVRPILPLLNASIVRASGLPWSDEQVAEIVRTMWAPWPGYYVSKELWVQHTECDGWHACNSSGPFEKPILLARGHDFGDEHVSVG